MLCAAHTSREALHRDQSLSGTRHLPLWCGRAKRNTRAALLIAPPINGRDSSTYHPAARKPEAARVKTVTSTPPEVCDIPS